MKTKNILLAVGIIANCQLSTVSFAQQDKQTVKKNSNTLSKKNHSLFKKSGEAVVPQSAVVPYTFSYSMGTYTNIANPISINAGLTWDDPTFSIPIGFNFTLWNNTISTINTDVFWLGGILTPSVSGIQPFLGYLADITDRASTPGNWQGMTGSLSPISYEVTGTTGNKIFKMEWKNAGFYEEIYNNSVSTDYVNLQMWLYEGTNNIEIRFGNSSITQPNLVYAGDPGPAIGVGMYDYNLDTIVFSCLQGNPAFPTDTIVDVNGWVTLSGDPPNGIIYKFTWSNITGITHSDIEDKYVSVFPNPTTGKANVLVSQFENLKTNSIEVYNVYGEKIYSAANSQIDLSSQPSGIYFIRIKTDKEQITKKLIINH